VKVDEFVYCLGGLTSGNIGSKANKCYQMNLLDIEKKWVEVALMFEKRHWHAAAVFKGNIVVKRWREVWLKIEIN